jgi:hypothetical protein
MHRCGRFDRDDCGRSEHLAHAKPAIGSITVVERYSGDG